jgi:hypothetical protein
MQTTVIFSQLVFVAPVVLVYLVGIVLAAAWWGRARRAAALAIAGLSVMLVTTLGGVALQAWLITLRGGSVNSSLAQMMTIISFARAILQAAGLGLLVAAVFAGRQGARQCGFDVAVVPAAPLAERG